MISQLVARRQGVGGSYRRGFFSFESFGIAASGVRASRLLAAAVLSVVSAGALGLGYALPNHATLEVEFAGAALVGVLALRRVELLYAVLVISGVLSGSYLGAGQWTYAEGFVVVVVAIGELARGHRLRVPAVVGAYCVWLLVASTRNPHPSQLRHSLVNYLLPPLVAVATAAVARDRRARRAIVTVLLAGAVAAALSVYFDYFKGLRADAVTGLFGPSNANVLALVLMVPATVLFALAVERARHPVLLLALALGCAFCGVVSAGRGIFGFAPAAFGAVVFSYGFSVRRSRGARRALALVLPVIVSAPLLVVAFEALNPGGLGPLTSLSAVQSYLEQRHPGGALPQRGVQLQIAVRNTTSGGFGTLIAGDGVGSGRIDAGTLVTNAPSSGLTSAITASNLADLGAFLTPAQQASGIWVGQILTETGWVGLGTFLLLLGYLIVLGRRSRIRLPQGSLERGLMVALPGLAWLSLLGAFYADLFFIPSFDAFFWPLVGLCIGIAAEARRTVPADGLHPARPASI